MLATQAQVVTLEENRVQLRLNVAALTTEANRKLLSEQIERFLGHDFRVEWEVGALEEGSTVAEAVREEKALARKELIERFKNDPFVQEVVRLFDGTIDEDSIREVEPNKDLNFNTAKGN